MGVRSAVMVGRDTELALLLEAFSRAEAGDAQVAVVTGEAGIGKTRLVRELVARLPGNALVSFGHGVPLSGGTLAYGVVADLLRSLVREVGVDVVRGVLGDRTWVLAPLVPRLGAGADRPVDRLAVFAATQDLLVELGADRTLVLAVEDIHWSDESSLELLVFNARTVERARVLLLVTCRGAATHRVEEALADLRRLPSAVVIDLSPLSRDAVDAQVRGLGLDLDDRELNDVRRLSDGIPLYVEELLSTRGKGVPSVVGADLSARLRRLAPDVAAILETAAVVPGSFSSDDLTVVSGEPASTVAAAIDQAVAAQLIEPADAGFRFRHELLRLAAVGAMSPSSRKSAHTSWAEHLKGSSRLSDVVSAAWHRRETGPTRLTLDAFVEAAELAGSITSGSETLDLWRQALMIVSEATGIASEAEHCAILGAAAGMFTHTVGYRSLLEIENRTPAPPPSSVRGDFRRLCQNVVAGWIPGDTPRSLSERELADITERLSTSEATPLAFASILMLLELLDLEGLTAQRDEVVDALEAMSTALSPAAPEIRHWVTEWRLQTLSGYQHETARLALARAARDRSDTGDRAMRAWAHNMLARQLVDAGDLTGACDEARQALALVPDLREQHWFYGAASLTEALHLLGLWDEAVEVARTLRSRGTLDGHWWIGGMVELSIAEARGDTERVQRLAEELQRERFPDALDAHSRGVAFASDLARVTVDDDGDRWREVLRRLSTGRPDEFGLLAEGLVLIARRAASVPTVDSVDLLALASMVEALDGSTLERCWRAEGRGWLARAGPGDDDPDLWRTASQSWERIGAVFRSGVCATRCAERLLQIDQRDQAVEMLGDALRAAESLGARPLADEIRTLASRARLRLPGHEPDRAGGTGPLTAREHEVLQLVVQGMTNDQIGSALFMSPRTASVHVSRILAKLGAANRTEVAAVAHRRGLVTAEG